MILHIPSDFTRTLQVRPLQRHAHDAFATSENQFRDRHSRVDAQRLRL